MSSKKGGGVGETNRKNIKIKEINIVVKRLYLKQTATSKANSLIDSQ
jgi:hypothetical protein